MLNEKGDYDQYDSPGDSPERLVVIVGSYVCTPILLELEFHRHRHVGVAFSTRTRSESAPTRSWIDCLSSRWRTRQVSSRGRSWPWASRPYPWRISEVNRVTYSEATTSSLSFCHLSRDLNFAFVYPGIDTRHSKLMIATGKGMEKKSSHKTLNNF